MFRTILLISVLFVSSCGWMFSNDPGLGIFRSPKFSFAQIKMPAGSPTFQKGYADGCATVLSSRGNWFYRSLYNKYQFDYEYLNDKEYKFGHARGYNFCFFSIVGPVGYFGGGADLYIFGKNSGLETNDLNDAWQQGNVDWFQDSFGDVGGGVGGSFKSFSEKGGKNILGSHPFWGSQPDQIFSW